MGPRVSRITTDLRKAKLFGSRLAAACRHRSEMNNSFRIRPASESDLAAINDIYNHYVLHSTCTYQEEPESPRGPAAMVQSPRRCTSGHRG